MSGKNLNEVAFNYSFPCFTNIILACKIPLLLVKALQENYYQATIINLKFLFLRIIEDFFLRIVFTFKNINFYLCTTSNSTIEDTERYAFLLLNDIF